VALVDSFQVVKEEWEVLVLLVDLEEEVIDSLVDLEVLVEAANPFQEGQVAVEELSEELVILKAEEVNL
jgi:hypothetical protein